MQNKISRCWKVIFPHLSLVFQIFYHQKWLKYQHSKLNLVLFLLVLNMKTVCGVAAAGITLLTVREILTRWSNYDQLVTSFQKCVLPAGSRLIEVGQGCVCFTIQVDNLTGLTALWNMYEDGTLRERLFNFFCDWWNEDPCRWWRECGIDCDDWKRRIWESLLWASSRSWRWVILSEDVASWI